MVETTDKAPENKCEAPKSADHAAAEALACTFDPKHAAPETAKDLPVVEFTDTEAEAQIQQNADLVRDQLTNHFSWQTPDVEKLTNILGGMTVEGRQDLIAKYDQGESKFWDDAKYWLTEGSPKYAAIEVLMNEKAATGEAANARVAMSTLSDDPEKGLNLLRAVISGKKSDQIATLDKDYQAAFGTTLTDAIKNLDDSVVSPQNKAILAILLNGSDKVDSGLIADMARLAVEGGDSEMLKNLLSGDQNKDIDARAELLGDEKFMSDAVDKFPSVAVDQNGEMVRVLDPEVAAAIGKGKVALDAVLTGDATGIHGNLENTAVSFENAPEQDRQAFRTGREIVESGREPVTAAEKEAVRKYNDLASAMTNVSAAQRAVLEDQLLHGEKTLISDIGAAYSEGGLMGIGSGFYNHDAIAAVENMDEHEYALLKDPKYKKEFDRQIAAMISDETLRKAVTEMVDAKLNAGSYAESRSVQRSLDQFMSDLAGQGSANADKSIAVRLSNLSTEEAQRYNSNPEFKTQVDKFASRYVREPISEALVNLQLSTVGKEKTESQVKLEQFLRGQQTAEPEPTDFKGQAERELKDIAQVEELMKDPELLARMKLVAEQVRQRQAGQFNGEINPQDQILHDIFESAIPSDSRAYAIGAGTFEQGGAGLGMVSMPSNFERLLNDGNALVNTKLGLSRVLPGDWLAGRYEDVARLSEDERARLRLSPEQQALVDNAVRNGGTLDLAGRFREFAVEGGNIAALMEEYSKLPEEKRQELDATYKAQFGADRDVLAEVRAGLSKNEEMSAEELKVWQRVINNKGEVQLVDRMQLFILGTNPNASYSDFRAELSKLTPQQRFDLKQTYRSDYVGNLDDRFLDTVPEKDIDRYRGYLSLEEVDAATTFFQRMARFEDLGTFDGTPEAHKRMLQVNENVLRQFNDEMAKLPLEAQEKMAEYYSKVYQNHLDSNEKYAHFVADMTITAAGIAAAIALTPATGGVSLGMVATYATVGGTARVAMIAEMEGGNFDTSPENMLKLGLVGAVEGALSAPFPILGGKALMPATEIVERKAAQETLEAAVDLHPIVTGKVVENTGEVVAAQADQTLKALPTESVAKDAAEATTHSADTLVTPTEDAVQHLDAVAAVTEDARKFDIPEGFVDLGNMIKAARPEDRSALIQEVFKSHPDVPLGSWMRLIEPAEMETFLRAAHQAYPEFSLSNAAGLVSVQRLRPVEGAGPIDFAAWEKAIKKVQDETASTADTAIAAAVSQEDVAATLTDDVVAKIDRTKDDFDAAPPVEVAGVRAPAAFPVEAVVDDAVRMQEMRASYKAGSLSRSQLEKAAESDDVARNLLDEVKESDRLAAAAAVPETTVVANAVADNVVDDAARLAQMEKDVAAGTLTRESLEASARQGDAVAQRMVATLAARDAEVAAAALERNAIAEAFEKTRLNAMRNIAAGRLIPPAIAPTVVSEVADQLTEKEKPVEVAPIQAPVPTDDLIAMATVRRGEGPWQSAERILAFDGKRHGIDEVRALTKAIQAVYSAENDGNGDMSGLKVKHTFVTKDNYDDLIAACNNDAVKAVLMGFAQGTPVS